MRLRMVLSPCELHFSALHLTSELLMPPDAQARMPNALPRMKPASPLVEEGIQVLESYFAVYGK